MAEVKQQPELINEITLENLLINRIVRKEYWLVEGEISIVFRSVTVKENDSFTSDKKPVLMLLANAIETIKFHKTDTKIPADTAQKIAYLESLPTQVFAKIMQLYNTFDSEIMALFESKKN